MEIVNIYDSEPLEYDEWEELNKTEEGLIMKDYRESIFVISNTPETKRGYIEHLKFFFGESIERMRISSNPSIETYIRLKSGIGIFIVNSSFRMRGYSPSKICIADEVNIDEKIKSEFNYLTSMSYRNEKIKYIRNKYENTFDFMKEVICDGEEEDVILNLTKDLIIEMYSMKNRIESLEAENRLLKKELLYYKQKINNI